MHRTKTSRQHQRHFQCNSTYTPQSRVMVLLPCTTFSRHGQPHHSLRGGSVAISPSITSGHHSHAQRKQTHHHRRTAPMRPYARALSIKSTKSTYAGPLPCPENQLPKVFAPPVWNGTPQIWRRCDPSGMEERPSIRKWAAILKPLALKYSKVLA